MMISGHKTRAVFDRYNIVQASQISETPRDARRISGTQKHSGNRR